MCMCVYLIFCPYVEIKFSISLDYVSYEKMVFVSNYFTVLAMLTYMGMPNFYNCSLTLIYSVDVDPWVGAIHSVIGTTFLQP